MEISLLVTKVLAIYLIVSGLMLLVRGKTLPIMLKDFFEHPAIVYLTGVILLFLSSIFLLQNNIWDGTWRTVVTIFGWMVFMKGLAYIFIPEKLHQLVTKKMMDMLNIYGILTVILGIFLFYIG